jgi:hypothetical protein
MADLSDLKYIPRPRYDEQGRPVKIPSYAELEPQRQQAAEAFDRYAETAKGKRLQDLLEAEREFQKNKAQFNPGSSTRPPSSNPVVPPELSRPTPSPPAPTPRVSIPKPSIPKIPLPTMGNLAGAANKLSGVLTAIEAAGAIGKAAKDVYSMPGAIDDYIKSGGSKDEYWRLRKERGDRDPNALQDWEKAVLDEREKNRNKNKRNNNIPPQFQPPDPQRQPGNNDGPGPVPQGPFDYDPYPQVRDRNTIKIRYYSPNNGTYREEEVVTFSISEYTVNSTTKAHKIITGFVQGGEFVQNENGPDIEPSTLTVTPLLQQPLPPYRPSGDDGSPLPDVTPVLPPVPDPQKYPVPATTPAPTAKPEATPKPPAVPQGKNPNAPSPTSTPTPTTPTSPTNPNQPSPIPQPSPKPSPNSSPNPAPAPAQKDKPDSAPFPFPPLIPVPIPVGPSPGGGSSGGGGGGNVPTQPASPCRTPCQQKMDRQLEANSKKLDALQTGLQGVDLALLNQMNGKLDVINTKLGPQLSGGGISGFLERFRTAFDKLAKWLHLDRVLNVLTFVATIHNAYMLSNALSQTFFSMVSNVLAAVGIKDAEGEPLNIANIVGVEVEYFIKSIIGGETVDGIKATWKKYSRIYQAAANIIWSVQSIGYSIISILEIVGSMTGKIGNALKGAGAVFESAYQWFNPQPNYQNRFFTAIQKSEDVVSQIDSAASEVLSVQDTFTNISQQKSDLEKALSDNPNDTGTRSASGSIGSSKSFEEASAIKVANASLPQVTPTDQVKPNL